MALPHGGDLAIDEVRREAGRVEAFELAAALREMEAALDPEGLSATARAVLARILRAGG